MFRTNRGERIRTSDFLLPKQARCQAAPRPATTTSRSPVTFHGIRWSSFWQLEPLDPPLTPQIGHPDVFPNPELYEDLRPKLVVAGHEMGLLEGRCQGFVKFG